MAWINLEIDAYGENIDEINDVRVMKNEDCEIAVFETLEEADNWCMENHTPGLTYSQVEIWG